MMRSVVALGAVFTVVSGHGSMTIPKPRNTIDGDVAPWNGSVPWPTPFDNPNWCATPSADVAGKDPHNLTGSHGQACFWFSNGCDISVDKCDGNSGQLVHPKWIFNGPKGTNNGWTSPGIVPDPNYKQPGGGVNAQSIAGRAGKKPLRNATICDPNIRTINTHAECGSKDDFYYYAPWRAPGAAPVIDSCGVAGGRLPGQGSGTAGADYVSTPHAKLADPGSALPQLPTDTTWTAGTDVEVAWTVKAFHGGGYAYRLCPANSKLDEDCFQKHHLDFVGQSSFRWGGVGGEQMHFNGTYVSEGTTPPGSMWAKVMVPGGPWGYALHGASFKPLCEESEACTSSVEKKADFMTCKCSGEGVGDIPTLEIVDKVHIPNDIPAGEWVVSWRWDCEDATPPSTLSSSLHSTGVVCADVL